MKCTIHNKKTFTIHKFMKISPIHNEEKIDIVEKTSELYNKTIIFLKEMQSTYDYNCKYHKIGISNRDYFQTEVSDLNRRILYDLQKLSNDDSNIIFNSEINNYGISEQGLDKFLTNFFKDLKINNPMTKILFKINLDPYLKPSKIKSPINSEFLNLLTNSAQNVIKKQCNLIINSKNLNINLIYEERFSYLNIRSILFYLLMSSDQTNFYDKLKIMNANEKIINERIMDLNLNIDNNLVRFRSICPNDMNVENAHKILEQISKIDINPKKLKIQISLYKKSWIDFTVIIKHIVNITKIICNSDTIMQLILIGIGFMLSFISTKYA